MRLTTPLLVACNAITLCVAIYFYKVSGRTTEGSSPVKPPAPIGASTEITHTGHPDSDSESPTRAPYDALTSLTQREFTLDKARDRSALLSASWDKFYQLARASNYVSQALKGLIIDRIAVETQLTTSQIAELNRLLDQEDSEATNVALKKYGGQQGLRDWATSNDPSSSSFWDELRAIRSEARQRHENVYQAQFSGIQMALINAHLRNSTIRISTRHQNKQVSSSITGFGPEYK